MRVLVVTPWFPTPESPGSGIFNLRDVELLAQDHEVHVVHLHDPALPGKAGNWTTESGIPVRRGLFSSGAPHTWPAAVREIRQAADRADILHTMAFPAILPVVLSRARRPWVHTEHWSGLVSEPTTARARWGGKVLRPGLRRPDAVVAVGQTLADVIDSVRHPKESDRTVVIGNHVRFASGTDLPAPPGIDGPDPLRVVGVGNLIPGKGPVIAVETIADLRARGVDAKLDWAGTGPLTEQVRARAEELGVSAHITLHGHLSAEELDALFERSHAFLLPTAGETFGVAIAEALAHGLPVVTSGQGGHRAFLPHHASRVVDTRDAGTLANALIDLATDSKRWSSAQIIAYAREQFSESRRAAAYAEVYDRARQRAAARIMRVG